MKYVRLAKGQRIIDSNVIWAVQIKKWWGWSTVATFHDKENAKIILSKHKELGYIEL